jgi:hypothetical protein
MFGMKSVFYSVFDRAPTKIHQIKVTGTGTVESLSLLNKKLDVIK